MGNKNDTTTVANPICCVIKKFKTENTLAIYK